MTRFSRVPRLGTTLALTLLLALTVAGTARAELFESVGMGLNYPPVLDRNGTLGDTQAEREDDVLLPPVFQRQAGSHPDFTFAFELNKNGEGFPAETVRDVDVDLPRGMVGNPTGMATCSTTLLINPGNGGADCPVASQVGMVDIVVHWPGIPPTLSRIGLFNLAHGPEVPARFGFNYSNVLGLISARVRPGDYGISSGSMAISNAQTVESVRVTLWGVPADSSHDVLRSKKVQQLGGEEGQPSTAYMEKGLISTDTARVPFLTAPTSCSEEPVSFVARADSWENPGVWDERTFTADENGVPFAFEGCEKLPFNPTASASLTTGATDSPAGLTVDVDVPQPQDPDGLAEAHVRKVKVTLPQGFAVNAASANGLGSCSQDEIALGTNDAPTCPDSSKLGTVTIDTPLLDEQLVGNVYLAKQNDNPFNSLLAMYIAVKGPGFYLKLPGKIDLDPVTGQVTTTFDDNPQLPFEKLRLELDGGPRAALTTPAACGNYAAQAEFLSWASDKPVMTSIPMPVDQNCAGGSFSPGFRAGTLDATAGSFSPFFMRITRGDGEQNLAALTATLPEGLLAKLAGVPLCGDAQAATAECPAGSQVGSVVVGAGSGSNPLYVPQAGKAPTAAYLAGPYKGAPYSLVVKVPAQAGPFDLGTVAVRNGLYIDPTTAQVTAKSDPLPQILQGIPIAYRDVRVEVNRPNFTINPTSCKAMKVTSTLTSAGGQSASAADGFRASECGELGFGPQLKLSLKGKMNRTGNPALKAVLKAPQGEANIAKTTVILPQSQFIDQSHISNPCTMVQFNADDCPAGSVLGQATAYTPLLDKPLTGPVYFRSNGGARELPDLVADLDGQIHVTLVGFIDSVKTGPETSRVRTRFLNVPDAPVSKFVIRLAGGKKGLIENSRNICSFTPKAKVQMTGQNGKTANSNLKLGTSCGKKKGA
ncbi:MAG: hypothetical protein E6G51_06225 [Actinobacteria bacterium]|nr:MAG: hypothetical protein E6G51_06225 [Actinomycetota bacterium]